VILFGFSGILSLAAQAHASKNILIDGDAGFERYRRAGLVTGSGTPTDPYVIAKLDLSGLDLSRPAIRIANTSKSFVVRNNRIRGGSVGIQIENARDGRVEMNGISGTRTRFRRFVLALVRSRLRFRGHIDLKGMSTGIELINADNIQVSKNVVNKIVGLPGTYRGSRARDGVGIRLKRSRNITLAQNRIKGVTGGVGRVGSPNTLSLMFGAGLKKWGGGHAGRGIGIAIDGSDRVRLKKNTISYIFGGAGGAGGPGVVGLLATRGGGAGDGGSSYGVTMSRSTKVALSLNRIERIFGGAGAAGGAGATGGLGGGGGEGGNGGNAHAIKAHGCKTVLLYDNAIVKVMAGAGGAGAAGGFPSASGGATGRGGKAFAALFSKTTGIRNVHNRVDRVFGGAGAAGPLGAAGIGLLGGASGRGGGRAGSAYGFAFLGSRNITNSKNRFNTLRGAAGGAGGAGSAGLGLSGGHGGRGADGGSAAGLFFYRSHGIANLRNSGNNIIGGRGAAGAAGATAMVVSGDGGHAGRGGHAALIWTMGMSTRISNVGNRAELVHGGRGGSGGAGAIDAVWDLDYGKGGRRGGGGRAAGQLITPRGAKTRLKRMKQLRWGIRKSIDNVVVGRKHGGQGMLNGFGDGLKRPRPPRSSVPDSSFKYRMSTGTSVRTKVPTSSFQHRRQRRRR
jgi:hypothetical protein